MRLPRKRFSFRIKSTAVTTTSQQSGLQLQAMNSVGKRHLNGWQRIGVVASVVWVIGGGLWGYYLGYHEGGEVDRDFQQCRAGAQNWYQNQYHGTSRYTTSDLIKDLEKCRSEYVKTNQEANYTGALYAVLLALLPIPLGWLAVCKSIALLHWIIEGFRT